MDTKSKVCHDLKTERPDVAPPLPAVASALPIAFYLACVGAVGLNLMFLMNTKDSNEAAKEFAQTESLEIRVRGEIVAKQETVKREETRGRDVLGWIEGSRSFQPIVVAVANSVDAKGSVVELGLTRDATDPKQIRLAVNYEGLTNDRAQIESMESALLSLGYRTYGAQQTRGSGRGSLAYEATLLWNESYSQNLTAKNNKNDE
ncbi:MAG: hypothetical protein ACI9UA_000736 [Pseudoalteromonas tetraodonis]|jgi:hypothetical protein